MNKVIHFRPIERRDYKSLQKLISNTWGYEKFCSPKTANHMAKLYLAGCLMEQTFTCVAECGRKAVGNHYVSEYWTEEVLSSKICMDDVSAYDCHALHQGRA